MIIYNSTINNSINSCWIFLSFFKIAFLDKLPLLILNLIKIPFGKELSIHDELLRHFRTKKSCCHNSQFIQIDTAMKLFIHIHLITKISPTTRRSPSVSLNRFLRKIDVTFVVNEGADITTNSSLKSKVLQPVFSF